MTAGLAGAQGIATGDSTLTLRVSAGPLQLLSDRAAYLPEQGLLLVADAHLGKAQAFRRFGVPVPAGTTEGNLQRLSSLITSTKPRELVFLGDLLHARAARSAALVEAVGHWRARHSPLSMRLIRGNHDGHAGDPPQEWGISCVDEPYRVGGWALCHHPQAVPGAHVLAGHTHPCHVVGRGVHRLRLPCFHISQACSVLPAFGEFTGLHAVCPSQGDRIVLLADGQLRLLST